MCCCGDPFCFIKKPLCGKYRGNIQGMRRNCVVLELELFDFVCVVSIVQIWFGVL